MWQHALEHVTRAPEATYAAWYQTKITQIELQSREAAHVLYSAFLVASRDFGTVISVIVVLLLSISAAHNAAPTVLVKVKKMDAKGINSRSVATVPNLCSQSV